MNNFLITFGLMFLIIIVFSLIAKFFDIQAQYYIPFMLWGIALCIFNLFLEKNHKNIFMENFR